jgi:crossover junction endodeoxyribonuclease RuvC
VVSSLGGSYYTRTPVRSDAGVQSIRVLGVDPGLNRTGWALLVVEGRRYRLVHAGVIAPRPAAELGGRLADGYRRFVAVLSEHAPDLVVIEDLFAGRHPNAALKMAHLRGVLCLAAELAGVEVRSLTATTVKQRLTGNGHASKEQVQRMVFELCDVSNAKTPSDLSDAVALAIAGLHHARLAPALARAAR